MKAYFSTFLKKGFSVLALIVLWLTIALFITSVILGINKYSFLYILLILSGFGISYFLIKWILTNKNIDYNKAISINIIFLMFITCSLQYIVPLFINTHLSFGVDLSQITKITWNIYKFYCFLPVILLATYSTSYFITSSFSCKFFYAISTIFLLLGVVIFIFSMLSLYIPSFFVAGSFLASGF